MVIRKICKAFRLSTAVAVLALCMAANASAVGTGQTTASQLNIRTEPFGPVITTVPEGTKLAILASSDGWAQVSVNGMLGYASMDYIVDAADSDFSVGSGMISADDVNFRSAPSTSAAVIGRFQSGTSVVVSGISDGWFQVSYNGKAAYVSAEYVDVVEVTLDEYNKLKEEAGKDSKTSSKDEDKDNSASSKEEDSSLASSGGDDEDGE